MDIGYVLSVQSFFEDRVSSVRDVESDWWALAVR